MDLRNNKGGEDETGAAIVSQFAKEQVIYLKETNYNEASGVYDVHKTIEVTPEMQIDVPIIVLVNGECISAGEGLAYNMARLDNVKVAGMTGTNGSFGTIKGVVLMPQIKIPINQEAAKTIFSTKEDYELNYIITQLVPVVS